MIPHKSQEKHPAFVGNLKLFTHYDFLERDFFTAPFSLGGLLGVGLLFGIGGQFRLLLRLLFRLLFRDLGLPGKGTLELLPYHEYGKDKYTALSMDYTMTEDARGSPSNVTEFARIFTEAGIHVIRT